MSVCTTNENPSSTPHLYSYKKKYFFLFYKDLYKSTVKAKNVKEKERNMIRFYHQY